jgi:hypothetical protein
MQHADWNAVRFDPAARRGHVESFFLKANDPTGDRALWLKATIFASELAPERPIAEGWAIVFDRRGGERHHVGVKHTLPYANASFDREGLGVRWALSASGDRFELSNRHTRGVITMGGERVSWDLALTGEARAVVPFPSLRLYETALPKLKYVTPLPDARFDGELGVRGERWAIEGWRGMQGHNWGRHAELYAWCHANVWDEDPELVLEGGSARVRVGPVLSPMTTLVTVRHRGVVYDMNRPIDIVRARGDVTLRRWTFAASGKHARIEGIVEADTEDMVGLYYPNPEGTTTYCLNSKLARARVRFEAEGRPPLSLTTRAAALEIGTRDAAHGVRMVA